MNTTPHRSRPVHRPAFTVLALGLLVLLGSACVFSLKTAVADAASLRVRVTLPQWQVEKPEGYTLTQWGHAEKVLRTASARSPGDAQIQLSLAYLYHLQATRLTNLPGLEAAASVQVQAHKEAVVRAIEARPLLVAARPSQP